MHPLLLTVWTLGDTDMILEVIRMLFCLLVSSDPLMEISQVYATAHRKATLFDDTEL